MMNISKMIICVVTVASAAFASDCFDKENNDIENAGFKVQTKNATKRKRSEECELGLNPRSGKSRVFVDITNIIQGKRTSKPNPLFTDPNYVSRDAKPKAIRISKRSDDYISSDDGSQDSSLLVSESSSDCASSFEMNSSPDKDGFLLEDFFDLGIKFVGVDEIPGMQMSLQESPIVARSPVSSLSTVYTPSSVNSGGQTFRSMALQVTTPGNFSWGSSPAMPVTPITLPTMIEASPLPQNFLEYVMSAK